jgi:hypothetical protein
MHQTLLSKMMIGNRLFLKMINRGTFLKSKNFQGLNIAALYKSLKV